MMPCRSAALVVSIMVFSQSVSGFSLANGAMFPQTLHSCTALGLNGFGSVSNARALERILSNGARATRSVRRSDDLRLQVEAEDEGLFQAGASVASGSSRGGSGWASWRLWGEKAVVRKGESDSERHGRHAASGEGMAQMAAPVQSEMNGADTALRVASAGHLGQQVWHVNTSKHPGR
eukprot:5234210-Pleurochrysis_carterae.AAC.2